MEHIRPPSTSELLGRTVSDDLDQLEVLVGRIGMNTKDQAISILHILDSVSSKLQENDTENNQSYKVLKAQYEGTLAKLKKESAVFLRDLGGVQALKEEREKVQPAVDHDWWYLDNYLSGIRKGSMRRFITAMVAMLIVIILLGIVYRIFLAPDPDVAARYSHEQSSRDELMLGNLDIALADVENGLSYAPEDPTLLVLKGVILESLGRNEDAQEVFSLAKKGFIKPEDFFIDRGQDYVMANQPEKALTDAKEALRINPDSAQAYLLLGSANESNQNYIDALAAYELAFEASDKADQHELSAMARMRMAMVMQLMNAQMPSPSWFVTATPTP